ncbi:outer membrane protein OprM precursor [bacterium BMS3Bbin05]|nr:outer membrane protein OprM precursor [bacterium BMS3Bbin05]
MKLLFMHASVAGIVAIVLTGCAPGPDFRPPELHTTGYYTASPLPSHTANAPTDGGAAQRFAFAQDLSSQWWTLFRSPELDALIKQGLADSPSLSAARAALREAQENLRAAGGALLYPGVDAGIQATKQRASGESHGSRGSEYDLYNASVKVSYTLDLFGGSRRRLEALRAQVDYQSYQFEAAYLSLTANIVTTAIREASLRAQIVAARDILAAEQKRIDVVKRQFQLGAVPRTSVLSQQSELAKTRVMLPSLEKQLAFTRHALSVLTGQLPSKGKLPQFRLDSLTLPEVLPISLPSALAHQRPDIRASEALLHQASAEVGIATANLYPQITLSGSYGTQATDAGYLFNGESVIWNLGAGLLQPIFHGGQLTAKRRAAIASYDRAKAQYRQTVLKAFQNVADVLRALDTDARTLQAQAQAETAAKATLDLTQKQFELGAVSYLSLLVAQRDYQQARINLIAAQAERYSDTAALFQALGGGWWNRASASAETASKRVKTDRPVTAGSLHRGGSK